MLRLLLDEGISREVMRELRGRGYDVEHVLDLGLIAQSDARIFLTAQQHMAALFTLNRSDYELLVTAWTAWGLGAHYGLVVPRAGQPTSAYMIKALAAMLERVPSLQNRVVYL